jgi:hypothetical protein
MSGGCSSACCFFAIGEAFRTGTHKAMIFTWLRLQGRLEEKTKVYGTTRSWSNFGSAVSIVIVTVFLLVHPSYPAIFLLAVIPYLLGLINLATYPAELEGERPADVSLAKVVRHLWEVMKMGLRTRGMRRLLLETMGFEGMFDAAKDYLQHCSKRPPLGLPFLIALESTRRSALLIGIVYFVLHVLSGVASRLSHRLEQQTGGEEAAIRRLWFVTFAIYAALVPLLYLHVRWPAIILFVLLNLLHNVWRPLQITRFDAYSPEKHGATVLSLESQAKSLATLVLAPLCGWLVDLTASVSAAAPGGPPQVSFWPIALLGTIVFLPGLFFPAGRAASPQPTSEVG